MVRFICIYLDDNSCCRRLQLRYIVGEIVEYLLTGIGIVVAISSHDMPLLEVGRVRASIIQIGVGNTIERNDDEFTILAASYMHFRPSSKATGIMIGFGTACPLIGE